SRLSGPLALLQYGISFKRYPCCYYVARAVDGTLSLRDRHRISPDDVHSVAVTMSMRNAAILRFNRPTTQNEARFSVPYCVSAALMFGRVQVREMSQAFVDRQDIQSYLTRVTL